jgi:hypothetical protein
MDSAFLKTQVGRGVEVHFDPPEGVRRKGVVKRGLLMDVKDGRIVVQLHGEQYPLHLDIGADQTVYAARDRDGSGTWWKFTGAQHPVPPGE